MTRKVEAQLSQGDMDLLDTVSAAVRRNGTDVLASLLELAVTSPLDKSESWQQMAVKVPSEYAQALAERVAASALNASDYTNFLVASALSRRPAETEPRDQRVDTDESVYVHFTMSANQAADLKERFGRRVAMQLRAELRAQDLDMARRPP